MSWFSRFCNALRSTTLDDDLCAEIEDHIERRAAALRADGLSPEQAQRRALMAFGNVTSIREQSREIRMWTALDSVIEDVRYGWRGLWKNLTFTLTAVSSLSLAIGATTAIYSIIDAAMLRPLPVPQPDRLFTLHVREPPHSGAAGPAERDTFSYPLYLELGNAAGNTARVALFSPPNRVEVRGADAFASDIAVEQFVSGNAFDVLQVAPAAGQLLSRDVDEGPGTHAVAVLSHDYWRRRFGADPNVVDQTIHVDGRPFRVIGVAAEGFFGVEPGKFVDVWIPATMFDPSAFTTRAFHWAYLTGRLAEGATFEGLQARLRPTFLADQIERGQSRSGLSDSQLLVRAGAVGTSTFRRTFSQPLWIVLAVALALLFNACSNVASLLLARSTARSVEMAVRISLGAGRARLVRQLLTENLLLSLLAGIGGVVVAQLLGPGLTGMLSKGNDPVRFASAIDLRVVGFCAGLCAVCGLFFGLLPAWQASASRPAVALRHSGITAVRPRRGQLFVGVQIAFAYCLVVAGAAFLFSLNYLLAINTGFDPKGVTVLTITADQMLKKSSVQQLQNQVAALANVQGAAVGWWPIFEGSRRTERVVLPGQRPSERQEIFYRISPNFFATLGTPLLTGRDLTFEDTDGSQPVPTIVNTAFAHRYFGGDAVLGQEFQRTDGVRHRIVGLAANAYYDDLRNGLQAVAYFPMKPPRRFAMYVRSTLDAGTVMRMVEREAGALGSGTHVVETMTLESLVGNTMLREKLLAAVGGVFAAISLLLAAIGVFGLLNYSVTSRTREIGVRAALGARRRELVWIVFRSVCVTIGAGLLAGVVGSLVLMRFSGSLLFEVRQADPVVMLTATGVFVFAALIAAGLPARRAARVDPLIALKQ